jgi:hypothetical protein
MRVFFKNTLENDAEVTFEQVNCVAKLKLNLFSMTLEMKEGWKVELFNELFIVRKGDQMITLHQKLPLGSCILSCSED